MYALTTLQSFDFFRYKYPESKSKYRNIKLIPVSDACYQAYFNNLMAERRSTRPLDYIPQEPSPIQTVSKDIEYMVRRLYGSENARILQYDVLYKGNYRRCYRELDILNVEEDGTVVVGEVKASSSTSPCKAGTQLNQSCEILSVVYPDVIPLAINVDMTSLEQNSDTEPEEVTTQYGFSFNHLLITLGTILAYADQINIRYDKELMAAACEEAKICCRKRMEKNQARMQRRLEKRVNEESSISTFGLILQNALQNTDWAYSA